MMHARLGQRRVADTPTPLSTHLPPGAEPLVPVLILTCDLTVYLLTVLDDEEVHEKQQDLSLETLRNISRFLNHLLFALLWKYPEGTGTVRDNLVVSSQRLLTMLREMDGRRSFTAADHWLLPALTKAAFQSEVEKDREAGSAAPGRSQDILTKMPHVIPFLTRVQLLRAEIRRDRAANRPVGDGPDPRVTIRRGAILTDGFRELSRLPAAALKGTIRIHFVNEQGLDEVGIDENGVFKEFLEQTVKLAFDPEFGLFRATEGQKLYPSITSSVHEAHMQLFEFVGRMLGKMMYEGIVLSIPLAHFFLNSLLGRRNTIDELPSLDPELAKNLNFIKGYDGESTFLHLSGRPLVAGA